MSRKLIDVSTGEVIVAGAEREMSYGKAVRVIATHTTKARVLVAELDHNGEELDHPAARFTILPESIGCTYSNI